MIHMNRGLLVSAIVVLMNSLLLSANAQEGPYPSDPKEGKRLALLWCTSCHVVSRDQPGPPTLGIPTPTFEAIANKEGTSEESLRTFILTTHATVKHPYNMPNPELADFQATPVIAYILSLKRP